MYSIWISNWSSWKKENKVYVLFSGDVFTWLGNAWLWHCFYMERELVFVYFLFVASPQFPFSLSEFLFLTKSWNSAFWNLSWQPKTGMALWQYYLYRARNDLALVYLQRCTSICSYVHTFSLTSNKPLKIHKMRRMNPILSDNQRPVLLSLLLLAMPAIEGIVSTFFNLFFIIINLSSVFVYLSVYFSYLWSNCLDYVFDFRSCILLISFHRKGTNFIKKIAKLIKDEKQNKKKVQQPD